MFERQLYLPRNLEKIVAWGGFASVKYVAKYVQPGLELISMDPKRSVSIVGPEALQDEGAMRDVALRLATDIGAVNQEGCVSTRVIYLLSGTDAAGIAKANVLGQYVYDAMQRLPESLSTPCKEMDPELRSSMNAARMNDDFYNVIGGMRDEGAIIVSQMPRPVDFAARLNKRVANIVPVDRIDDICDKLDSYVQTVAVYPESLKLVLRNRLSLFGVQRFATLGYAANATFSGPQDALEPLRELCRWVISEDCDPAVTPPLWEVGGQYKFGQKAA